MCDHRTTRVDRRTGEARCLLCEATWSVRREGQTGLDAFLAECPVCREPPPCPHVTWKRGRRDEVTVSGSQILRLMPDPDATLERVQGRDTQDGGSG